MREQKVAVAVVPDQRGRFLVAYNEKWSGYAFPMQDFDPERQTAETAAVEALERDLGSRLPRATASELEYLGSFGRSGRTGEDTWYDYWLLAVDPGQPLDVPAAGQGTAPPLFLDPHALLTRDDLTWSTPRLACEFLENQEVVLAIITRPGDTETEYLVLWSENYQGFFFPATRVKNDRKPEQVAARLVRADLGYRGPAEVQWRGEVDDVHFSGRLLGDRTFHYHVCQADLLSLDLGRPHNPLELALRARGKRFRWCSAEQLASAAASWSPTMAAVRSAVLSAVPPRPARPPVRRSEGAVALICRHQDGRPQWLAQWNERWRALYFIGGHREADESFRECLVREIHEELRLRPDEFSVAPAGQRIVYRAWSQSAGCETSYCQELFPVTLGAVAQTRVERDRKNAWLGEDEIRRLEAGDGRPISVTALSLLLEAGGLSFDVGSNDG